MQTRLIGLVLVTALVSGACVSQPVGTTTAGEPTTSTTFGTATSTSGVGAPALETFIGADGVESTITDTSRIVTLSGDLTEIVWRLGFGDSVVATDVTTVYPPEAVGLPVVGVGRFLSAEGVLAQEPTLVIGDTQTSPLEAIEQIRNA
ncbi:MAG: ABC transporter substrate-binding protein, partial [Acidimicrobiia bacterium]|nr:ABC transporter substrate-binding protein [Acidimicrobiia bacterium]